MTLPRLVYLGHVPVEASSGGSALLYRLLEKYPADRLLVIEPERSTAPGPRLKGVQYETLPDPLQRGWNLLRTRFPRLFWPLYRRYSSSIAKKCELWLEAFQPEAILTVHERFAWVAAAAIARGRNLPLHLILHDEWSRNVVGGKIFQERSTAYSGGVYRSAASRLCVCPYMEEDYRARFGVAGSVLFPSRSARAVVPTSPPERLKKLPAVPVAIYAGNIFQAGYWRSLQTLAESLISHGGKVVLYTPYSLEACRLNGLTAPNVDARAMVGSGDLARVINEEADILFAPMSFDAGDQPNMSISFPSKIVDYASTGIPILISGPSTCSAIRWAKDHPAVAEIVEDESREQMSSAVRRLLQPSDVRYRLGGRALEVGQELFSHEKVQGIFYAHLRANRPLPGDLAS